MTIDQRLALKELAVRPELARARFHRLPRKENMPLSERGDRWRLDWLEIEAGVKGTRAGGRRRRK